MFNIIIIEDDLTEYEDVVLNTCSTQTISSRGQWTSQSPGPGQVRQNFGRVKVDVVIWILYTPSHKEDLDKTDNILTDIQYQPYMVSLIIQIGTTGVPVPSNIELSQSLSLSSLAVSDDSLQSPVWYWGVNPSCDDIFVTSLNTTGISVVIL